MGLLALQKKAGQLQAELEKRHGGQSSYRLVTELAEEVGEVAEAVKAEEGVAGKEDAKGKIGSELADVMFSVLVLAEKYDVDLDKEFLSVLDGISKRYL